MYLIPPEVLKGKIHKSYAEYMVSKKWDKDRKCQVVDPQGPFQLIGYWPAREHFYFCCNSAHGAVAPVVLGYTKGWKSNPGTNPDDNNEFYFNSEYYWDDKLDKAVCYPGKGEGDWILFFVGCDDGHTGKRFKSKVEALQWIADCPEIDFYEVVYGKDENGKRKDYGLEYHN